METEFSLSQAVVSGDAFEHRPSERGHCVQDFSAELDLRDLPGEAVEFEFGADDALPTAHLRSQLRPKGNLSARCPVLKFLTIPDKKRPTAGRVLLVGRTCAPFVVVRPARGPGNLPARINTTGATHPKGGG